MIAVQVAFWSGVFTLYAGFAAVLGILLRKWSRGKSKNIPSLIWLHFAFLVFPSSLFVVFFPGLPIWVRLLILSFSVLLGWTVWRQPVQLPTEIFQKKSFYRFFGVGMALAAFWGIGFTIIHLSISHLIVGTSAAIASLAVFFSPDSLWETF